MLTGKCINFYIYILFILQLQQQLELTNNLYQSLLHDQGHQQQHHQHGNNLLPAVGTANNLLPYWNIPPPQYLTPQPSSAGKTDEPDY